MDKSINLQIREFEQEIGKLIEESNLPSSILLLEFQKLTNNLEKINEQFIQNEIKQMQKNIQRENQAQNKDNNIK